MRYLCVHCDKTFEHENEAKKPRCPTCMRVNGLEVVAAKKGKVAKSTSWVWWAVAGGVLACAGVGYAIWASQTPDAVGNEVPMAPLDDGDVRGHLRRIGVDARDLSTLLVPNDAVETWAERAAGDASGSQGKARAVLRAIRARADEGAFERWSFGVPRETPFAPPSRIIERLRRDGAHHHLYPLELAALMTAALRALDVNAMVAEVIRYEGDRSPPDPSGQIGYFVVAVYDGDAGTGDPRYYDPYGGRRAQPEARVLTDLQAIGDALGHRALHLLSRESDPDRALEAGSQALELDARSPSLRAVRGAILVAVGQRDEAIDEFEAAKQLRRDAPRRNLVAAIYMAQGDLEAASREISEALEEYPDFAPGHATLAAIHLSQQELELARAELEEAERIDPELHTLSQFWAGYYAATGNFEAAIARAQEAIDRNPTDVYTHLLAAQIFRQASRYDLMRREARAALTHSPEARRAELREMIRRMLGPTALEDEEVEEEEEVAAEELEGDGTGALRLDSPLLDGEDDGPSLLGGDRSGPSLLGDGEGLRGPGGGGLQLGGGGGDGLRLGGGGDDTEE